jgi:hypothetical protein
MSQDKLIGIARLAQAAPELQRKHFATYSQLRPSLLNRCDSNVCPSTDHQSLPRLRVRLRHCYARYTHEFMGCATR